MCLGVPYRVIGVIDDDTALVRVGTAVQTCFVGLTEGVREGDWLLVHAGFAVQRIGEREARENLELIERYLHAGQGPERGLEDAVAGDRP